VENGGDEWVLLDSSFDKRRRNEEIENEEKD